MAKVKYVGSSTRAIPKVGKVEPGQEFECDDETAEGLCRSSAFEKAGGSGGGVFNRPKKAEAEKE